MFGLTVLCASISLNLFTQRCKLHDGLDRNDLFPALNMREDTDHQMDFRRTWKMKANYFLQLESAIESVANCFDKRQSIFGYSAALKRI